MKSSSKQQQVTNAANTSQADHPLDGQSLTKEQLSDVYAAGTSDGYVQLEQGAVQIPSTGYEETSKRNNSAAEEE